MMNCFLKTRAQQTQISNCWVSSSLFSTWFRYR